MTPDHYADVIRYAENVWPTSKNYKGATDGRIAQWFAGLNYADAIEAINRLAKPSGENVSRIHAPTIVEIRDEAERVAAARLRADPLASDCTVRGKHGPLAILGDHDMHWHGDGRPRTIPDGHRVAICVDCQAELIKPADLLLTDGERQAAKAAANQPPDPDRPGRPVDGDRSDRIAP